MLFHSLSLEGAYRIELEKKEDSRGFFARIFCTEELSNNGTPLNFTQASLSHNAAKGTVRGLHYQAAPFEEDKIVYCIKGHIFDVIVDIRPDSPTKGQWVSIELSESEKNGILIPKGFAHGFQTLADESEVLYLISTPYAPNLAKGIHWKDPTLAIPWPLQESIISERDRQFPFLNPNTMSGSDNNIN